jgi:hypothetical protein
MEETQQRLKDTAEACIKAYDVWGSSKKNAEAREALQESLHELRKVAARLEIEMASSERDETNQRQIPIPPHRASRARHAEIGNELPDFITDAGSSLANDDGDDGQQPSSNQGQGQNQHRGPRQHGGGARRPFQNRRPHSGGQSQGNQNPSE